MDAVSVFDGDARAVFARSRLRVGGFCTSSADYDGNLKEPRAWQAEQCVLREKRV